MNFHRLRLRLLRLLQYSAHAELVEASHRTDKVHNCVLHYACRLALFAALFPALLAASTIRLEARHDIHIGYCRAVVLPTVVSGKVTYYKDDFLAALRHHQEQHQQKALDFYSYLNQHLQLQAEGGKHIPLIVDQYGQDESTIWFTFKFYFSHSSQALTITHSSLTDLFSDQLNITNLTGLVETSGTLSASRPSLQLNLPAH